MSLIKLELTDNQAEIVERVLIREADDIFSEGKSRVGCNQVLLKLKKAKQAREEGSRCATTKQ